MPNLSDLKVLIRGGGEVASGIAYRLHLSNIPVCLTETDAPVAVTRGTAFSDAVYDGVKAIMGVTAELIPAVPEEIYRTWEKSAMPIIIDPETSIIEQLKPDVLIDAIMAKVKTSTRITDAPLVIGVGPGFYAGKDVHVVIESNHRINLGKVISEGEAEENTGIPVTVGGLTKERVIWSPGAGVFTTHKQIGDTVLAGEVIGKIENIVLKAPLSGMLRGLIRSGIKVDQGTKLIEVDHIHESATCNYVTDKALKIGDGVLKAIKLHFSNENKEAIKVE